VIVDANTQRNIARSLILARQRTKEFSPDAYDLVSMMCDGPKCRRRGSNTSAIGARHVRHHDVSGMMHDIVCGPVDPDPQA